MEPRDWDLRYSIWEKQPKELVSSDLHRELPKPMYRWDSLVSRDSSLSCHLFHLPSSAFQFPLEVGNILYLSCLRCRHSIPSSCTVLTTLHPARLSARPQALLSASSLSRPSLNVHQLLLPDICSTTVAQNELYSHTRTRNHGNRVVSCEAPQEARVGELQSTRRPPKVNSPPQWPSCGELCHPAGWLHVIHSYLDILEWALCSDSSLYPAMHLLSLRHTYLFSTFNSPFECILSLPLRVVSSMAS